MAGQRRKDVSRRMARIQGHVHGIAEMLDEGKPYSEIVHQISAVRASLDSVVVVIVDELVEESMASASARESTNSSLEELKRVVAEVR